MLILPLKLFFIKLTKGSYLILKNIEKIDNIPFLKHDKINKRIKMKIIKIIFLCLITIFSFAQAKWEFVNPLPVIGSGVHHPLTFSIGDFGYSVTGNMSFKDTVLYTKFFYKYNALTDEWIDMPDFPGLGRSYGVGLAYNGKGYVGFGIGAVGSAYKDLWEFDPVKETWKRLADCPCEERIHPAFVAANGKIFVGAGNNSANLKDWWEYNIETDKWTAKSEIPGPKRHHPFYFAIDSFAYVGFGHGDERINGDVIYRDFHKYNVFTEKWTSLDTFPGEQRVAGIQFDSKGKGYILSGDGPRHLPMKTGEFWEYDPKLNQWKALTPHIGTRSLWAPGGFAIGDYTYLIGGEGELGITNDVQRIRIHESVTNTKDDENQKFDFNVIIDENFLLLEGLDLNTATYNIMISSSTGQSLIKLNKINSNKLDIHNLSEGYYNITLSDEKHVVSKGFIKMN